MKEEKVDLAAGSFIKNWHPALRWLLFVPAAIVIAIVAQALFYLVESSYQDIKVGSFLHGIINMARTGIMFGLFIYIGAFVAPHQQFIVSIILLMIATIFASFTLFATLISGAGQTDKLYYVLQCLVAFGVSGIVVYQIKKELP